jgi:hypothetical protein
MKLELTVPSSQVAKIKLIIELLSQSSTGKTTTFEKCLEDQKTMAVVSEQLVNRIVQWAKKIDALNKLKSKKPKSTELTGLKKIDSEANPKAVKKPKSTSSSKKKTSKTAATASES